MNPPHERVLSVNDGQHGKREVFTETDFVTQAPMKSSETALLLIGFQHDYFATNGILRSVIEDSAKTADVIENTVRVLKQLEPSDVLMLQTPILFSDDYAEINNPIGLLKAIAEFRAFRPGQPGSQVIPQVEAFGSRIDVVQGKDGFNAFSIEGLGAVLKDNGIKNLVLAGAITSINIDSTGRSAHENGYDVTVLSDCTCGRTDFEQEFYCQQILPLYAHVLTGDQLLARLK